MVESDSVERIKYLWKRSNLRKYMRKFIIRKDIVKKKVVQKNLLRMCNKYFKRIKIFMNSIIKMKLK